MLIEHWTDGPSSMLQEKKKSLRKSSKPLGFFFTTWIVLVGQLVYGFHGREISRTNCIRLFSKLKQKEFTLCVSFNRVKNWEWENVVKLKKTSERGMEK